MGYVVFFELEKSASKNDENADESKNSENTSTDNKPSFHFGYSPEIDSQTSFIYKIK